MGVVKHVNAPKYYPLRLKLCEALTRLGYHAKVFIPLSPFYLDILSKRDLYKTSNKGGDEPIQWDVLIKVTKQVRGMPFHAALGRLSLRPRPSGRGFVPRHQLTGSW